MPYGEGYAIVDLRGNTLHESWVVVGCSRSPFGVWRMMGQYYTLFPNRVERLLWVQCRLSVLLLYPCDAIYMVLLGVERVERRSNKR